MGRGGKITQGKAPVNHTALMVNVNFQYIVLEKKDKKTLDLGVR